MSYLKEIILRILPWRGIAGNGIHVILLEKAILTAGKHLVRIGLMRNVKDKLVPWGVKDIMHSHCSLGETKIWAYMTTIIADPVEHAGTNLIGKHIQFIDI